MRMHPIAAGVAVAAMVVALLAPAAAGDGPRKGYWTCSAGAWVAVGTPRHEMPPKPCGWTFEVPRGEAECERAGGRWSHLGLSPRKTCVMPAGDAGRVCGDSGECEGMCLADLTDEDQSRLRRHQPVAKTGYCSRTLQVVGCVAPVTRGRIEGRLCID
ncbi:MAG: hypothetical protein R3D02_16055 [Hyphomicrobiales bacterium]